MSTARWSLGVAVLDNILYAIGGSDNRESYSNSVEVYDAVTDKWSHSVANMNNGRRCLGVAVVNDLIYVVGGRVVNSIEYYDKDQNVWTVVGTVNTRCNFGCVALRLM
jgi:N-acetylneuraminic acid mutarotase